MDLDKDMTVAANGGALGHPPPPPPVPSQNREEVASPSGANYPSPTTTPPPSTPPSTPPPTRMGVIPEEYTGNSLTMTPPRSEVSTPVPMDTKRRRRVTTTTMDMREEKRLQTPRLDMDAIGGSDRPLALDLEDSSESESEESEDECNPDPSLIDADKRVDIEWKIENFKDKQKKWLEQFETTKKGSALKSPVSVKGDGAEWGLLVFPLGLANSAEYKKRLSVYVELRNPKEVAEVEGTFWDRDRHFIIRVVNHKRLSDDDLHKQKVREFKRKLREYNRSSNRLSTSGEFIGPRLPGQHEQPPLSQPEPPFNHRSRKSNNTFNKDCADWGFVNLLPLAQISEESGFLDSEGALTVRALVYPQVSTLDSKRLTGMVGLENHGATCYLNSLLQTLYMTKKLRLDLYELDTSQERINTGIGLELQRLFWKLQSSATAVSTRSLTTAFGWGNANLFRQHDAQEMNRELIDKLESRLKNTDKSGTIKSLYIGKTLSYIKCINVDFTSQREEEFYDIQLDVKGLRSVSESFDKYIEEEKLEGDNQYEAEGHGKQDALKGIRFLSFPPVLNLHLKRFAYDVATDATVKINDRFKFPVRLNLAKYLHDSITQDERDLCDYVLHSVLVHVGDVNSGHYYAFINDLTKQTELQTSGDLAGTYYKSRWVKFDDTRVSVVPKKYAVKNNFGSGGTRSYGSLGNAYMLVYVQRSKLDEVLVDIPDSAVPPSLIKRFADEEKEQAELQANEERSRNSVVVYYATDVELRKFHVFKRDPSRHRRHIDFVDFENGCPSIQVDKTASVEELQVEVSKHINVEPSQFRIWTCVYRENNTFRPDEPVSATGLMLETASERYSYNPPPIKYFVELLPNLVPQPQLPPSSADDEPVQKRQKTVDEFKSPRRHILVCIRQFFPDADTESEKLKHLESVMIPHDTTGLTLLTDCIIPTLKRHTPEGSPSPSVDILDYQVYEIKTPKEVTPVHTVGPEAAKKLRDLEVQHGDIFVFQVNKSSDMQVDSDEDDDEAGEDTPASTAPPVRKTDGIYNRRPLSAYKYAPDYISYLDRRFLFTLVPYSAVDMETAKLYTLEVPWQSKFDFLQKMTAAILHHEGEADFEYKEYIRFHISENPFDTIESAQPLKPVQYDCTDTLWKMLGGSRRCSRWTGSTQSSTEDEDTLVLFYELLPCVASDHERLFEVQVVDGKYPLYKTVLVFFDCPESEEYEKGFSLLGSALLREYGLDQQKAHVRWLVVEGKDVDKIYGPNEQEDPTTALPNCDRSRETSCSSRKQTLVADIIVEGKDDDTEWDLDISGIPEVPGTAAPSGPFLQRLVPGGDDDEKALIGLAHFESPTPSTGSRARRYGVPFSIILRKGDTKSVIMAKVKKRLRVSDDDIKDWKLAVFHGSDLSMFDFVEDGEDLSENDKLFEGCEFPSRRSETPPMLGLFHPKNNEATGGAFTERVVRRTRSFLRGERSPIISDSAITNNH